MNYLNLKNGSVATEAFSMFYTQNVYYACVDSIAAEYDVVAAHMGGPNPVLTCDSLTSLTNGLTDPALVVVYPNPSGDAVFLKSDHPINQVRVLDLAGNMVQQYKAQIRLLWDRTLDLSPLPSRIFYKNPDARRMVDSKNSETITIFTQYEKYLSGCHAGARQRIFPASD